MSEVNYIRGARFLKLPNKVQLQRLLLALDVVDAPRDECRKGGFLADGICNLQRYSWVQPQTYQVCRMPRFFIASINAFDQRSLAPC
jgi:hypothetical protein